MEWACLYLKVKFRRGLGPVWEPFSDVMEPTIFDRNTQKPNSMDTGVRKEEPRGAPTPPLRLQVLVTPPDSLCTRSGMSAHWPQNIMQSAEPKGRHPESKAIAQRLNSGLSSPNPTLSSSPGQSTSSTSGYF